MVIPPNACDQTIALLVREAMMRKMVGASRVKRESPKDVGPAPLAEANALSGPSDYNDRGSVNSFAGIRRRLSRKMGF